MPTTSSLALTPKTDRNFQISVQHDKDKKALVPSSAEQVAQMLAVVAATIGCDIPVTAVLAKYIELLRDYPPDLIEKAGNTVLKKHKWNNFPKIAEFIEPIEEIYNIRRESLRHTLTVIERYKP